MINGLNIYCTSKVLKEQRAEGLAPVSNNNKKYASGRGLKPVFNKRKRM